MTLDELKSHLLSSNLDEFVDQYVLSGESKYFTPDHVSHVATLLTSRYSKSCAADNIFVVGSAKLSFGLFKKKLRSGEVLPPFRPFRPDSDIDLAIVHPHIYEAIWDELSTHAINSPYMPWDSGKLGDYMVYGWLRPDHFPKNVRLRKCDDWWDAFRELSADSKLGRRAIRGALFYSKEHLRKYQVRGLNTCRLELEAQR